MNDINKQIQAKYGEIVQKDDELTRLKNELLELKKKKCEKYSEEYADFVGKKIEFVVAPGCTKHYGFFLGVAYNDDDDIFFPIIYRINKDGKASKNSYPHYNVPQMHNFDALVRRICE